jgi:hypothetical protein
MDSMISPDVGISIGSVAVTTLKSRSTTVPVSAAIVPDAVAVSVVRCRAVELSYLAVANTRPVW